MATNLSMDPTLIERALEVSGERTRKAVVTVTLALEEFIARRRRHWQRDKIGIRMNPSNQDDSTMPISIKDPDTDSKIRDLAALTGESITVAVRTAIEQRLRRESARRRAGVATRLLGLSLATSGLKRFDESAEDAIGYDESGLPR